MPFEAIVDFVLDWGKDNKFDLIAINVDISLFLTANGTVLRDHQQKFMS